MARSTEIVWWKCLDDDSRIERGHRCFASNRWPLYKKYHCYSAFSVQWIMKGRLRFAAVCVLQRKETHIIFYIVSIRWEAQCIIFFVKGYWFIDEDSGMWSSLRKTTMAQNVKCPSNYYKIKTTIPFKPKWVLLYFPIDYSGYKTLLRWRESDSKQNKK